MAGYLGASPVPQTIQKKQSFTATASQTTFTTTGYTDGAFINVYLNGVRLINGTDYTATNGSDIVLTTGASASDVLDFETFNEFTLVDQTLETPTFRTSATLKNDTEEDTDGGRESTLIFKGEQSGGEISTLAEIEASHDGTSDDEKGDLIFRTNDGSDGSSPTEAARIDSSQNFGIGTTSPSKKFVVSDGGVIGFEVSPDDAGNGTTRLINYNRNTSTYVPLEIEGNTIRFETGTGGTVAERARITDDGITFNGDTAAANALYDYEESTWTPDLGSSVSSLDEYGTYTKIGRVVFIEGTITVGSNTNGSHMKITNFPFTMASGQGPRGGFALRYSNYGDFFMLHMDGGATQCGLYSKTGNVLTYQQMSGKRVDFFGFYHEA